MKHTKRALVTGVTGFIGYHLALRLADDGWEIHAIVRKTSNIEKLKIKLKEKIIFHVNDEENDLRKIVKKAQPDVVFHLASLFLSNHAYQDISALVDSNIKFGTELLDAMVENKIYRFVNTGTSWQHYNNAEYNPVNLYAASKQAFEMMMKYYQEISPLNVINLKLYDTYGPNDNRKKIFALLEHVLKTGERLQMSKGEQLIDLVHIDDVVNAFILSAIYLMENKKEYYGTYAVSSGKPIALKTLVEAYENIIGEKLNIAWGDRQYREREVMVPWNMGTLLPGWQTKFKLSDIKRFMLDK